MPSETLISLLKPSPSPSPSPPTTCSPPSPPHHPTKSSNWLDRLRSSKGFPDSTDHINLDHFLSTPQPPSHSTPNYIKPHHHHLNSIQPLKERDLINHVLSDLFYMGDSEDQSRVNSCKTRTRKQPCPRICVVSTNSVVPDVQNVREVNEVEERDLSKYSQTEVTVIDTSVPCWKFEKVLYRSKNVWKVGDRKGKGLVSADRKKRKDRVTESADVPKKKKKLKKKLKKLCNSFKCVDKEGSLGLLKSDQGHEQGKVVAGNEKKRDSCSQVQEKSFCKKQIDEGSSVILIKSIPTTNKKNVSGVSNNCVKSMQR